MTKDDLMKLSIALSAAMVGWLLAQVSAELRSYLHRRKVRKALLSELSDIYKDADRRLKLYERKLQLFGAKGLDTGGEVAIRNPIFEHYFKDVVLSLNQAQRLSYKMIDGLIRESNANSVAFNALTDQLRKIASESNSSKAFVADYARWGDLAKAGYFSAAIIKWHSEYHRENKKSPELKGGDQTHKKYLLYLEDVQQKINLIIESGTTIPLTNFEQIFDPAAFPS